MRAMQRAKMVTSTVDSAVGGALFEHVNPLWVRLLDLLEMNVPLRALPGSELFTADGGAFSIFCRVTACTTSGTTIRR